MSKLTAVNHQPATPPVKDQRHGQKTHELRLRRLGIDTHQEAVIYMRDDCHVCRSEGFEAQSRILVRNNSGSIVATLNVVRSRLLAPGGFAVSGSALPHPGLAPEPLPPGVAEGRYHVLRRI